MTLVISTIHFNSHAHVERDHFASGLTNEQLNFNSHAHVERDDNNSGLALFFSYFNSHAHVERDTVVLQLVQIIKISTHTLTWSVTIDI